MVSDTPYRHSYPHAAHTHRLPLTCTTHTHTNTHHTHAYTTDMHTPQIHMLLPPLSLPPHDVLGSVILGKKKKILKSWPRIGKQPHTTKGRGGRNIHARTPMPRIAQSSLIHLCSWRTAGTVCQAGKRSWEGSSQILPGNAMIQ